MPTLYSQPVTGANVMFFRKDAAKDNNVIKLKKEKKYEEANDISNEDYLEEKFPEDFKNTMEEVKKLRESFDRFMGDKILSLQDDIKELKTQNKEMMNRVFDMMEKLVERPSAASQYLAQRQQPQSSGFAKVDNAAKK